jgi:hypothetical protein
MRRVVVDLMRAERVREEGDGEVPNEEAALPQPQQKKGKPGPEPTTAANAPPGHAKQIFLPDPRSSFDFASLIDGMRS